MKARFMVLLKTVRNRRRIWINILQDARYKAVNDNDPERQGRNEVSPPRRPANCLRDFQAASQGVGAQVDPDGFSKWRSQSHERWRSHRPWYRVWRPESFRDNLLIGARSMGKNLPKGPESQCLVLVWSWDQKLSPGQPAVSAKTPYLSGGEQSAGDELCPHSVY